MVLGEDVRSLAQGLHQTFSRLMEGKLQNTNYVVIIVTTPGHETQSCVVVTGWGFFMQKLKQSTEDLAECVLSVLQGSTSAVPYQRACFLPVRG